MGASFFCLSFPPLRAAQGRVEEGCCCLALRRPHRYPCNPSQPPLLRKGGA